MTRNFFLNQIIALSILAAAPVQAMSRHHDGEARAWIQDDKLCLGVAPTYETSGFLFSRAAQVDDNDVRLYAISVSAIDKDLWNSYIPPEVSAEGVKITADTCIVYGQDLANLVTKTPAQPLKPGLYSVILEAGDQKNRRARFYTKICLSNSQNTWLIKPVSNSNKGSTNSQPRCE